MKVRNMTSNGREVPNQFIIVHEGVEYYQSYSRIIAVRDPEGNVTLDERYWEYSVTTGKYRNQFLGESKKETQARIASGEYKLANLN